MSTVSGSRSTRKGFTLIELLVVIAIIAILAAILFPVFAQAREKARQTSCLSNQKQIGTALIMYVQDYDETFPAGERLNRAGSPGLPQTPDSALQAFFHTGQGWAAQIYPLTKSGQALKCPDDSTATSRDVSPNGNILIPVSYSYNHNVANSPALAAMNAPANTIVLAEVTNNPVNATTADELNTLNIYSSTGDGLNILAATDGTALPAVQGGVQYETGWLGGYGTNANCLTIPQPTIYKKQQGRHSDGGIFFMGDGHAKFFKPGAISPGADALATTDGQNCMTYLAAGTGASGFGATFSTK